MSLDAALGAAARLDPDDLADALIALSEKQRRSLHAELMERTKTTPSPHRMDPDRDRCFFIALWGTGTSRAVRNAIASWRFVPDGRLADVVAVRPQKTIDALVRGALRDDWDRGPWFVVRDLVRAGVISHPDNENYAIGLAKALPMFSGPMPAEQGRADLIADVIVSRLHADDKLPGELLEALSFSEAVNWMSGTYVADTWLIAFQKAVDCGLFERDVILDASLDGQLRDLRKSASSFFRKLFASLEPTIGEMAPRADKFIRIISASAPSEQSAAAKILRKLARAGTDLDGGAVASAVVTPLTGSQKGAAVEALRLLSDMEIGPTARAQAAIHGLGHPHADVQEAALRLIEKCGAEIPAGVRSDALVWVDAVAPALRSRLVAVAGVDAPALISEASTTSVADRLANFSGALPEDTNLPELLASVRGGEMPGPLEFNPWTFPDLGAPMAPIEEVDDLVATLTVVLAGTGSALDLERVIDGLSRFDPSTLSDAALSPVRAMAPRNEYIGDGWFGWEVRGHVEVAARYWCERKTPPPLPYLAANKRRFRRSPSLSHDPKQPPKDAEGKWWAESFDGSSAAAGILGFLSARLWEAVNAARTEPRPTLALPSTTSGWIDDAALFERLAENERRGVLPGRFDAIQALLRLRPGSSSSQRLFEAVPSPIGAAVRRFRGATASVDDSGLARAVGVVGQPQAIRLISFPKEQHKPAITVLRYELDEPTAALRRDDPVGQLVTELEPPTVRPVVNTRWTHAVSALFAADRLLVDWTVIGLPRHRDVVAARAAALLAEDLDSNRSTDRLHSLLSAASDPDVPLSFAMHVLLAMGLADRNVVTSVAAADLLHDASIDGRLDPELLGSVLAELGNGGLVKPARFAKATAAVVPVSPLLAERVRQSLCAWLGKVDGVPRDLHAVLETLELACAGAGTGVDSPAAVQKLADAATGSSKRAKSARRLLELPVGKPSAAVSAAGHALLDRAERSTVSHP